jgi:hypothetical protein
LTTSIWNGKRNNFPGILIDIRGLPHKRQPYFFCAEEQGDGGVQLHRSSAGHITEIRQITATCLPPDNLAIFRKNIYLGFTLFRN